jgi:L-ascorbate metabolism protein UlaG (beta-lactamase superfamily)
VSTPARVPDRITHPARADVRIAALWIGHATVLLQMDDRFVLTDPVFTDAVAGGLSKRLVEPGLDPANLPAIDMILISHLHVDHLSLGSLDLLAPKTRHLVVPEDGAAYLPDYDYAIDELPRWTSITDRGMRITAVPVKHSGYRYGADLGWMTKSFTGYVIEYAGLVIYFGGDSAYDQPSFVETARRFPHIDLAVLPISPVEPRGYTHKNHMDGREAIRAFQDLHARYMVPIHYGTFAHGADTRESPLVVLRAAMRAANLDDDRVRILPIGGQFGLLAR